MAMSQLDVEENRTYVKPVLGKITLEQLKAFLSRRIKSVGRLCQSGAHVATSQPSAGASYERPMLRKLTPEQGTLLALGYAMQGDQGAKELLEQLFPSPAQSENAQQC